jgi:glucose/mannose transport system substrate-binding protein
MVKGLGYVVATAAVVALGASCGAGSGTAPRPSGNIEIFSWWVSGGEANALSALLKVYTDKYPVTVINSAASNSATARQTLQERLASGQPPDTFQANGGDDLMQWVLVNGSDASSKLEPLDAIAAAEGWQFPAPVTRPISHSGHLYGVPVDIHRENSLFYNGRIFADNQISPPTASMTWDQFYAMCDELVAKGITPVAFGLQGDVAWTHPLPPMEGIFAGMVGADYYDAYFTGKKTPDDPSMRAALTVATKLLGYSDQNLGDKGAGTRTWSDACDQVQQGRAAMTLMGDWAKGYFAANGWKPGVDFNQIMIPSAAPLFTFTTDVFGLPKGAPDRTNTVAILNVFGSLAGQYAFNPLKGSIPARSDADMSQLDVVSKATAADFHSMPLAAALSILAPTAFDNAIGSRLKQFASDGNIDAVINVLNANYNLLHAQ